MKEKEFKKFIFYFSKSTYFILNCFLIFIYTKIIYTKELIDKMVINSGFQLQEIIFLMGICLGIWLLFSFIILVFMDYKPKKNNYEEKEKEKEKKEKDKNDKN